MPKLTEIEKIAKFNTLVYVTIVEYGTSWRLLIAAAEKRSLSTYLDFSHSIKSKMLLMHLLGIGFDNEQTEIIFNNIDKVWNMYSCSERVEA